MGNNDTKAAEAASQTDLSQAQIAEILAENARLKARLESSGSTLTLKPSKSGGLSIYGMGRYPTTLYPAQWLTILDCADDIRKAIDVGNSLDAFATKGKSVTRDEHELELIRGAFAEAMAVTK